jgi:hypothetical protein
MADFIAFNNDFTITYSIYDAIELQKQGMNMKYYCLCTKPIFIKNESIIFTNKKGNHIQRHCHFSHYKNSNCVVKKAFNTKENVKSFDNKIEDAPEITEVDKRVNIITKILKTYYKSLNKLNITKGLLRECINIAINNNIDHNLFMNDFIKKILLSKTTLIGFKEIEHSNINCFNDVVYVIGDIEMISNSLLKKICSNFERYKVFIKSLSLIALYASRCINFDRIDLEAFSFIKNIEDQINIYKKLHELRPIILNVPNIKSKKVI